jgi:hypothetical protein
VKKFALALSLYLYLDYAQADGFSATAHQATMTLEGNLYQLTADIDYTLSSTVNEALIKGVPLVWVVTIKVKQEEFFIDMTLQEIMIRYQVQYHALLNLYSVKKNNKEVPDMFSSQAAALNFMSKIDGLAIIEKKFIQPDRRYYVAIKVAFIREALPVLLRPLSYFDSQWALSSHWATWRLKN